MDRDEYLMLSPGGGMDMSGGGGKVKYCGVCGDKALGYNFNAISCESCKAFFRRNALKNKNFKCPFEGRCKIDPVTRRFCQKCRLQKCFQIGMKKEWIMSEEEKCVKRAKIEENRKKRMRLQVNSVSNSAQDGNSTCSDESETAGPHHHDIRDMFHTDVNGEILCAERSQTYMSHGVHQDGMTVLYDTGEDNYNDHHGSSTVLTQGANPHTDEDEEAFTVIDTHSKSVHNHSPPSSVAGAGMGLMGSTSTTLRNMINNINPLMDIPLMGCSDSMMDVTLGGTNGNGTHTDDSGVGSDSGTDKSSASSMQTLTSTPTPEDIAAEKCAAMHMTPLSIRSFDGKRSFNAMEQAKMEELRQSTEIFKHVVYYQRLEPNLLDVIKMTDGAIRRIIKFSKRLSSFKTLCVDDQIALLKGGCTEILILRSAMAFDPEKECWQDNRIHLMIKLDILKEAKEQNIYEAHKRFLTSFDDKWKRDENIIHILTAITLFNPDRHHIVHRETISLEQKTYMYLLERYLEIKYNSACEAKSDLVQLMKKLEDLRRLNEEHVKIYLDVDPNHVGPLLIEIFDLKQEHI